MNNLTELKWQDASGVDGIYCEKTNSYIKDALWFCSTLVADYVIKCDEHTGKYIVNYGGRTENEHDTVEEAKHWCEHTHYASKMQPYVKPDSITDIANWFQAAKPDTTIDDLCVQIGCHLEEVAELLEALGLKGYDTHEQLTIDADAFKNKSRWVLNKLIKLSYEQRIAIVDACCDINVTSVGVMQLLGGVDVLGAQREVTRSNNSKMVNGKFEFDANGKIMKAEGYSKPDLTPFVK